MIDTQQLSELCRSLDPQSGIATLSDHLQTLISGLELTHVLSRSGWHRQGGVVTTDQQRITRSIEPWAEAESGGDVTGLLAYYNDKGYLATRISGTSHYFTVPVGDRAEQFIQLEIEELQEVIDRALVDPDHLPDDLQEFCDPVDCVRLQPDPVGRSHYRFRRIVRIDALLAEVEGSERSLNYLQRFLSDWDSSTIEQPFCDHWVFALQEYRNKQNLLRYNARPIPTYRGEMPDFTPGEKLRGVTLANTIHGYDRRIGYPFAWFFLLMASRSTNHTLAQAVLADQVGAYDYLPARDLKILRDWAINPYSV